MRISSHCSGTLSWSIGSDYGSSPRSGHRRFSRCICIHARHDQAWQRHQQAVSTIRLRFAGFKPRTFITSLRTNLGFMHQPDNSIFNANQASFAQVTEDLGTALNTYALRLQLPNGCFKAVSVSGPLATVTEQVMCHGRYYPNFSQDHQANFCDNSPRYVRHPPKCVMSSAFSVAYCSQIKPFTKLPSASVNVPIPRG